MFESLERGSRLDTLMRFASFLASLAFHFVALCTVVVLPLLFFNVIEEGTLLTFLYVPPPPPVSPPAPSPPIESGLTRHNVVYTETKFTPPEHMPDGIPPPTDEPAPAVELMHVSSTLGVQGAERAGFGTDFVKMLKPDPLPAPLPPIPPRHAAIRVGGIVQASKLVVKVEPAYPAIARLARVSGTVILQVTIDEEGIVSTVEVLSGNPLLNDAAVRAVRQWRYSPTLLNGEPIPVIATVTVNFKLQ